MCDEDFPLVIRNKFPESPERGWEREREKAGREKDRNLSKLSKLQIPSHNTAQPRVS